VLKFCKFCGSVKFFSKFVRLKKVNSSKFNPMIRKLLFTAALIFSGIILSNAQCTPGPYTTPGIYPDTVANLPVGYALLPYSGVITAVVPADTVISGFTLPIDSIGVTNVSGLPTGFIWTTNTVSHYWHGGTAGCFAITGTATHADTGWYHLNIFVKYYVAALTAADTVFGYKIHIKDTTLGVNESNIVKFTVAQNNPNPFSNKTSIEFTSPNADVYSFSVSNIIGEVVYTQSVNAMPGSNKFEFSAANLPSGIYMYKLGNKSEVFTRRMIVSGK
jgi:hypothetical protein